MSLSPNLAILLGHHLPNALDGNVVVLIIVAFGGRGGRGGWRHHAHFAHQGAGAVLGDNSVV